MRRTVTLGFCLFLPLLLALSLLLFPPVLDNTYVAELPAMLDRLQKTDGQRIVVIGGSSVPFSLRSDLLREALGNNEVVDFGLYAPLSIPVMLDLALPDLRQGDLVVIQCEQHPQLYEATVSGLDVLEALESRLEALGRLHFSRLEPVLAALPAFLGEKLRYSLLGRPELTGLYVRESFNLFCDLSSPLRDSNIMPAHYDPSQSIDVSPDLLTLPLMNALDAFYDSARSRGADVVWHFPPMNELAVAASGITYEDIDDFYDALTDRLPFAILGNPHDCVLDAHWFYDTNFHLNESGAVMFTSLLADDLKVYLRDTQINPISLPVMPAYASTPEISMEGQAQEAVFLYEPYGDGWRICGLTSEGLAAEELTLPVRHMDLPVLTLTSDALQGATRLRKLCVPAGYALPDAFLSGVQVRTLSLLPVSPGDLSAGDHLLQGTDAVIQVPPGALETYRRHYVWHRYADRMVEAQE